MKVLVIGQVVYDIILPLDKYPEENTKVRIYNKQEFIGGSAANASKVLNKYGMDVYFAGVIGNDAFGDIIKDYFNNNGTNIKYLETSNNVCTPSSYIVSNITNGKRTIITNRTKDAKMSFKEVDESFDIIYSDGYEYEFFKEAVEKNPNALKIIDAGSMKEHTIDIAKMCDYVICSKDFAENYANKKIDYDDSKSIIDIYECLNKDFDGQLIITLEERGAFTFVDEYKLIPSIKVNSIDSSGAGDIFHGAFTYFINNRFSIEDSIKLSNIVAAKSCEKIGTENIISYDDLMKDFGYVIEE